MSESYPIVAKFGGTSMARPLDVLEQLSSNEAAADVVIVSAPGTDAGWPVKTTDLLRNFQQAPTDNKAVQIRDRFGFVVDGLTDTQSNFRMGSVVDGIIDDLWSWHQKGMPVEALGERWSAQLFSALSGYRFVDAIDLIQFNSTGLDQIATQQRVQAQLKDSAFPCVVPGYYGSDKNGTVRVLERGGSDVTGAIITLALGSIEYHNWSDVDGFMSADPKYVTGTKKLETITYREARELANGGAEILQKRVQEILGHTAVATVMRNTFGAIGNRGTLITAARDTENSSVIGVTGQAKMLELSFHEFGLQESVGGTVKIFDELRRLQVSWEHAATATDDLSIFLSAEYADVVHDISERLSNNHRLMRVKPAAMMHVVGEGLKKSGVRKMEVIGQVALALSAQDIECMGATDVASSAALTFFVKPEKLQLAVQTAHDILELGK